MKTRRQLLRWLGVSTISSASFLNACSDNDDSSGQAVTAGQDNNGVDDADQGNTASPDSTSDESWASGRTDLISVDYPDDSLFESGGNCLVNLTDSTTLGPCYFQDSTEEDISEGLSGLPMQLCLRLVDSDCVPLENYTVEIWHCDIAGIYSGDTASSADAGSFNGNFCTGGDTAAESSSWYRGQLTTNENGRVNFKTHFPGWYRGRTIHIHFRVSSESGTETVISQFAFTDQLALEVCTTHPLYASRGEQDTTLASGSDTVFPSADNEMFVLNTERNQDGSLLAWHTIQVS